ncbi:MAG: DNA gyrase subunit A [Anaerovoracaceae bacterium]|nr:DNA gyrase subunit A [Bacillota bacterium]MDY2670749.1 DNA gyrase subunit A [Anaerovoracaceae bacterium]
MENMIEDSKAQHVEINKIMRTSYINYSMSVIIGRALPDVRDGLKPVHRRILYDMMELGVTPDKPHRKSARIVGDVLGKYHPHGDSSVYDAMVRLAQKWNIRYPLVDGHGNFGSVDGDSPAAMRYTEARMTPLALQMLRDINKDTVDFQPNFDGDEREPVVLPSRFPNLLVNGSNGIAVGMATSIPPHNLTDVINAVIKMIDDKECTIDDIIDIIKAPDFPTGAEIIGYKDAREAYRTGQGKVTVRSKYKFEETSHGKMQIVFTEIPYQVNKARLIEKIAELVKTKKIDHISDIRDESDRDGMRIVIELKKDANPRITLNRLLKHTQLQENQSIIMIALVNGEPKILNIYEILSYYLDHQKEVVTRRTRYDLKKAQERAHILEGYLIALDNIDEVIRIIRSSYNDAKEKLMERFSLSDVQAQAILDMRLARLQGLEREKIEAEYADLMKKIDWFNKILSDESVLMGVIRDELIEIRDKFGDERRTDIVPAEGEIDEEALIERKQVAVTLTHLGYVKRMSMDNYKTQRRGGKGITGLTTRENDFVKDLIITSTHDNLLFFTNTGKVYRIKAYEIPEGKRTARGTPVVNFLNLMQHERVTAVMPVNEFSEDRYLVAVTRNGIIKKTALEQFDKNRKNGLLAIKLKEGDELIDVKQTTGDNMIIIVTKYGKSICFNEGDVRPMGRMAGGVKAIQLDEDDEVVSLVLAENNEELLVVTSGGFGKRTPVGNYTSQKRGGKGILTYDKNKFDKTGPLVGAMIVNEDDEVMLINSDGIIIRIKAGDVNRLGRTTQGVKIMKVADDSNIIAIAKIPVDDSDDGDDPDDNGSTDVQMSLDV